MTELRTLVRRHQAGLCIREELRDRFQEELDRMRGQRDKIMRETGIAAVRDSSEGAVLLDLDDQMSAVLTEVRVARFAEALTAFRLASSHIETLEEIHLAHSEMKAAQRDIADLQAELKPASCSSVNDLKILLTCAGDFYAQQKYRKAFALAQICCRRGQQLTSAAPSEVPESAELSMRIKQQRAMLPSIERWSQPAASHIQETLLVIESIRGKGWPKLAEATMRDLEISNGPIEEFLAEVRRLDETAIEAMLREWPQPNDPLQMDWRQAAVRLIADSLSNSTKNLNQLALSAKNTM